MIAWETVRRKCSGPPTAEDLVFALGKELVGREVITEPMDSYPGGRTRVTKILPDADAPEIVFAVEWAAGEGGEIGVFSYEKVTLLPED